MKIGSFIVINDFSHVQEGVFFSVEISLSRVCVKWSRVFLQWSRVKLLISRDPTGIQQTLRIFGSLLFGMYCSCKNTQTLVHHYTNYQAVLAYPNTYIPFLCFTLVVHLQYLHTKCAYLR